jgi:hypothetical protein
MVSADCETTSEIVSALPPGTSKLRPQFSPVLGPFLSSICKEAALLLKTSLIAAAVAMTVPAYAQQSRPGIRIITPYGEHIYSADPAAPGWLPDDENLRLQNERVRARLMRQMERERELDRQEADE